ncbi:hypothetical protein J2J97_16020 [Rhizobium bangladeshense]|nr:hypothetical protein J2J97_16020 [Rhizobium bangladeshense]
MLSWSRFLRGRLRIGASGSPASGFDGLRGGFVMAAVQQQHLKKQFAQNDY